MNADEIAQLLAQLQRGEVDVQAAVKELLRVDPSRTASTADAQVDVDRHRRCGFPEVVYCEGKTTAAIIDIFQALTSHGQSCFGTRVSAAQAEGILQQFPDVQYNAIARTVRLDRHADEQLAGKVAVITAGTSDRPVAEEALETLRWMKCGSELISDVGVAGPHRLAEQRDRFSDADAVVVVAGMEGALPSVVGGYVESPVIAVPTSVGYGASFGGVAALLGMLNSCASNVTVVNIDSGFKGGYVAGLIARRMAGGS
ncbi:MAG: nickel pincer cofactor biosynthesis protein LarB [Planctomycetaceae bacterium]|nr:nickel pincer cofactor biosynthesis protein LarB [Planctomycetaceae bacterium]MBT6156950.1 nickel pincer cofactor biosynthesis protein LarB [Planctomycetaceae bacterium]MBT6484481.1 nickel pincer cofactor biosynthesis protein LarB [Planctomycetaceae bacterium]MBT6498141.1 nickel pincer cofactor biosynthesis protein LarB [Planctomycetaceae bacterium]